MIRGLIILATTPLLTSALPFTCPAFEPFRCPEEKKCIAIQVIMTMRRLSSNPRSSISVMARLTAQTAMTKTQGCAPRPGGLRWKRPPASSSPSSPPTAPTTWRSCLGLRRGTTCSCWEEWMMSPLLFLVKLNRQSYPNLA